MYDKRLDTMSVRWRGCVTTPARIALGLSGWIAAAGLGFGWYRQRAAREVLAVELEDVASAIAGYPKTLIELMRNGRDIALSSLLAVEQGVDISADLRSLVGELDSQLALIEEHVL